MKSKRPAISLHMLFLLMDRKSFTMEEVVSKLGISRSSFFRALSDFRCYLQEYHPEYDLILDDNKGRYYLSQFNSDGKI